VGSGGLLAAALARAGTPTIVLVRPEALGDYPRRVSIECVVLGDFESEAQAAAKLEREVDML